MTELSQTETPDDSCYTFVLGRVHDKIGGPTRTIWGYVEGLESIDARTKIVGLGTAGEMTKNFSGSKATELLGISGTIAAKAQALFRIYRNQQPGDAIVVVGAWHLSFFVIGILRVLSNLLPRHRSRPVILIPTMSLTTYDWAKHRFVKRCLRPVVGIILSKIDGVVFASTGERDLSGPQSWRRSEVILHPSVSITAETTKSTGLRDLDVLFVGRLDPQKDLPLLFKGFADLKDQSSLHLVGDGDPEYVSTLKEEASKLGISSKVVWHGWKTHSETLEYFRRSRVVAVTSLVENYCHAAVEALVAEADLVLVDRVMSAADFARLADIDVTPASRDDLAQSLKSRLASWSDRSEVRRRSSSAISHACSPVGAASALRNFVANV